MQLVNQSATIIDSIDTEAVYKKLEACGRVCYKSESLITTESAEKFLSGIIKRGHESVLEHYSFTVRFITDRATSHQIVRHRLASYSQESQRYVNYEKRGLEFIQPMDKSESDKLFLGNVELIAYLHHTEELYNMLIEVEVKPEDARSILPNCTKTELIMTANIREWRHFLKMRTDVHAQHNIRELATDLLDQLVDVLPVLFLDIKEN